jgi:hypothetical protein
MAISYSSGKNYYYHKKKYGILKYKIQMRDIRNMKGKKKIIIPAVIVVLIAALVGIYFFIKYQSYEKIEITKSYEHNGNDNANYKYCLDAILRYSRDGIALLTESGDEIWNQPCQMGSPIVEVCGESIAVGDKGGTSIFVFQRKGLKGEIKTTLPIEKLTVSSQGIVGAILREDEIPRVMCYDAKGNVLVEHKVSLKNMGYPTALSLAENGKTLLVSYLRTAGTEIVSKISYYYFGDEENESGNYQIFEREYQNTITPVATYINKETSLLVADNALHFYSGTKKIKHGVSVELGKEIQGVAYDDKMVAVLLKSQGSSPFLLQTYNIQGELLASVEVEEEYRNIKVDGEQIILFDGRLSSIYMKNGVHKFTGNVDENIIEMYTIGGLNKYMMINASGFHEVGLVN